MSADIPDHQSLRIHKDLPYVFSRNPVMIYWEITRACSLSCKHCRAEAQKRRSPLELSTQESINLLDQLTGFTGHPAPHLVITGGDPLMRPDLLQLIAYGLNKGLKISLAPSATGRLTKKLLFSLKKTGLTSISLSLDGSNARIHDTFRMVNGCFETTVRAAASAREAGLPLQINTLVSGDTVGDLPAIYTLISGMGIMRWSLFYLIGVGRGKILTELTPPKSEQVSNWLYDLSKISPFMIKTTEAPNFRRIFLTRMRKEGKNEKEIMSSPVARGFGVRDGNGIMFISHLGEIFPSGFLPLPAGNVRRDNPVDIYRNSEIFIKIRDTDGLTGKCGICGFRTVCGGSRARAFARTGNFMESDPLCPYQPVN